MILLPQECETLLKKRYRTRVTHIVQVLEDCHNFPAESDLAIETAFFKLSQENGYFISLDCLENIERILENVKRKIVDRELKLDIVDTKHIPQTVAGQQHYTARPRQLVDLNSSVHDACKL
jgi:hypothetical protein